MEEAVRRLSEDSVAGFFVLCLLLGIGSGMMFDVVKDKDFCLGFALVVGTAALLVTLCVAKVLTGFEKDEDEEDDEE